MRYVYAFAEGSKDDKDLLGGKGANLAEMTSLGLPVPPGFTITTEACRAFRTIGHAPEGLGAEIREHLGRLEEVMGRRFGDAVGPAADLGAVGREVLDAGNDGDRPQHRTQRRDRPGGSRRFER